MMSVSDLANLFILPSLEVECSARAGMSAMPMIKGIIGYGTPIVTMTVAVSANNVPMPDANVRVKANVGTFQSSYATTVFGKTDSEGMFRGEWAAENSSGSAATFEVMVSKDGFSSVGSKCSLPFGRYW